jgi:predicted ATP-grasp superfamily ATP-dependent carboligase
LSERVLVLGDDVRAFLGVVRSLGRRGLEVHAAPSDFASPALASRFIARLHRLPAYAAGPKAWESGIAELIASLDFRLVIPCSDSTLVQLHHHRAAFGAECLALPNDEAFALFTDKIRTRALAQSLSVPVAQGRRLAAGDTPDALIERYGLPLLLKPPSSYQIGDIKDKRPVQMVRDAIMLESALAAREWKEALVESYFEGDGIGVSVLARRGQLVQTYQHRRLRQFSETGVSTSRVSEPVHPELYRDVVRLAKASSLDGIAMFEFKRHRKTGAHVLIEVNPRFWGSLPLAIAAGADFPAMLYDQRLGFDVAGRPYRTGMIKRDLGNEYESRVIRSESAKGFRKLGLQAAALFTPLAVRSAQADSWAADDPAPHSAERAELKARIGEAMAKRIRRKHPALPTTAAGGLRSA